MRKERLMCRQLARRRAALRSNFVAMIAAD
jgi:hypothetical protein